MKLITAAFAACLLTPSLTAQTGVLDQQSPFFNVTFGNSLSGWSRAQDIMAGTTGQLEGMEFSVQSTVPNNSATIRVYLGSFNGANPLLFTGQVSTSAIAWETVFVDMTSANIQLTQGQMFSVECVADGMQFMDLQGNSGWPSPLYPWGYYENAGNGWTTSTSNTRIGFNTYMLTPPSGPTLSVSGICGTAPSSVDIAGATPGGTIALIRGTQLGSTVIPGAAPNCQGIILDLQNAALVELGTADAAGAYSFSRSSRIPSAACGAVIVQALDVSTCTVTPTLAL